MIVITLLIWFAYLHQINCGNIRLVKFGCTDGNTSSIPEWIDPDKNIFLKELCSIQAIIKGFHNNETLITSEDNSELISDYQLLILLSLTKSPDFKSILNLIKLDTLMLSEQNLRENGMCEMSVDNVSVPAVEFCGEAYLVAVLQKNTGLQVSISGFLVMPLKINCNEKFIDLALIAKIPIIDTVVNFGSQQNYMKVVNNFKVNVNKHRSNKQYSLPNDIQIYVKNNGNQTLRQRCGIFLLPVISFIIAYNDSDWLPLGTDNKQFASLLNHSDSHLLKSSLNSFVINSDNGLFNSKHSKCSPQIQPNQELMLNMSYFRFSEADMEKLAQFSQLISIIDPFNTINDMKRENNVYVLPLYFQANENKTREECIVQSNPMCFGSEAIVIHNSNNSTVKTYLYNSEQNMITKINSNDALNTALRYHLQNWFINGRLEQLLSKNECPKEVHRKFLFDQFTDLLTKLTSSIARIPVKTEWQNKQLIRIKYLCEVTRNILIEIKIGFLKIYRNEVLNFLRDIDNNKNSKAVSIGDFLNSIKNAITTNGSNSSVNNTHDSYLPIRLGKFLNRVTNEHINVTFRTIPQSLDSKKFVKTLKNVLIWLREDSLFDFNLPKMLNDLLIEAIDFARNNVTKLIEQCIQLSEKHLSLLKDDKTNRNESIILFKSLLKATLVDGVWNCWHELRAQSNHLMRKNVQKEYIAVNEIIDDNYGVRHVLCVQSAINDLLLWKAMPEWLTIVTEVESVIQNNIELFVDMGVIKRYDIDDITGLKYWSPVMICECRAQCQQ